MYQEGCQHKKGGPTMLHKQLSDKELESVTGGNQKPQVVPQTNKTDNGNLKDNDEYCKIAGCSYDK